MFYFFEEGAYYLRCELHQVEDGRVQIIVGEPGSERTESFDSVTAATTRWHQLVGRSKSRATSGSLGE